MIKQREMETILSSNLQLIQEIERNIPILNNIVVDTLNEFKNYLEYLKFEQFTESVGETEEESIKKAEGIYDRLDEVIRRNKLSNKKANETNEKLSELVNLFDKFGKNEKEELFERNNELIDTIIDLEQRKTNKLIMQYPNRKYELKGRFKDKKKELNKRNIDIKKCKQSNEFEKFIVPKEMKQIEKWTQLKIGNIIFDSDVDNWDVKTSVFNKRILNKSNLIFLIEDDDGNKFGGYINAKISDYEYIYDPESFVFSLKSNGRLDGMLKFDINDANDSFLLENQTDVSLFQFGKGGDILIRKANKKHKSFCDQTSFNYDEIEDALCGKQYFTPKRITVIQLF